MVRTTLTARSWLKTSRIPPWLMNRRQRQKVSKPIKIKLALPEQKTATINKAGNVIKTIQVRQKTKYFNNRNARKF